MTDWIVSNAWWFAPSLAFAGVGMFVGALLWPRKASGGKLTNTAENATKVSNTFTALQSELYKRGRHLAD